MVLREVQSKPRILGEFFRPCPWISGWESHTARRCYVCYYCNMYRSLSLSINIYIYIYIYMRIASLDRCCCSFVTVVWFRRVRNLVRIRCWTQHRNTVWQQGRQCTWWIGWHCSSYACVKKKRVGPVEKSTQEQIIDVFEALIADCLLRCDVCWSQQRCNGASVAFL